MSNASTASQVAYTWYSSAGPVEGQGAGRGPGGHAHTEVTGTELAKVTAAVKAKDAAVTVQRVQKDPDGSYDVIGTKDGNPVMLEVSKDLKTIETRTGGPGGGRGGHAHTEVTGTELAKVTTAVKAKDAAHGPAGPEGPRRVLRRDRHQGRQPGHARGEQGPQDHRDPNRRPRRRSATCPLGLQLLHVNDLRSQPTVTAGLVPRPERRTSPADDLLSGDVLCSRAIHNQPRAPLSDVSESSGESAQGSDRAEGQPARGTSPSALALVRARAVAHPCALGSDRPLVDDLDGS